MKSKRNNKTKGNGAMRRQEPAPSSLEDMLAITCIRMSRDISLVFDKHLREFINYRDEEIELEILAPLSHYICKLFIAKHMFEGWMADDEAESWMTDEEEQKWQEQEVPNPGDPEQAGADLLDALRALSLFCPKITNTNQLKENPHVGDNERKLIARRIDPISNKLKQKFQSLHRMPGSEQAVHRIIAEFPECVDWITEVPHHDS